MIEESWCLLQFNRDTNPSLGLGKLLTEEKCMFQGVVAFAISFDSTAVDINLSNEMKLKVIIQRESYILFLL